MSSGGDLPPLDAATTAVVCIEFQNEFTTEGGKLHDAVKAVMASTGMLANAAATVDAARKKGALILHCPIVFTDDYRELRADAYGILANVKDGGAFKKTEWGGEICKEMTPHEGDSVVEGKRGLCGFASTNLDFILRQRGIKTIALCGFLTNCCVESSMRSGYEKGYRVITLTDCCAATSQDAHDAAVAFTFPMFSLPAKHTEFLAALK
ncbi:isochorismatase [Raphidocelis subcapitata]|uniref:Isochorismatase n=1 Tax=Raphidocelis subcapitata TaxID=307507 RepID=A0A2V0NQJ8_9CHLO|nr:isochorismatase [Raphidocelis subcapitata]|eukprot:GBF88882.1 isochorismatase [Raphidocelis subcapitata]